MKNKILILFFLSPLSANACPDLSGSYNCKSLYDTTQKSAHVDITQQSDAYTVHYSTESNTLIADGKPSVQTVIHPETGIPLRVTLTGVCEGETLVVKGKNIFPKIEGTAHIVKADKSLLVEVEGQLMGQALNQTIICE